MIQQMMREVEAKKAKKKKKTKVLSFLPFLPLIASPRFNHYTGFQTYEDC
jgi:hypothetical protein